MVESPSLSGVRAWWRLIRGGNSILAGAASLVGMYITDGAPDALLALYALLAPALLTAAGNIDNDICDETTDRMGQPDRPIPAGEITAGSARWGSVLLAGIGLAAAGLSGLTALSVAAAVILLLAIYNRFLSRLPLAGNMAVALMGGLPLVYGAICMAGSDPGRWVLAAYGAGIAFWLHLAREILKDVRDVEGDRDNGRRTLPVVTSAVAATRWGGIAMLPAAALSLQLGISALLGILYLFGVVVTVVPALLLGAAQCIFNPVAPVVDRWTVGLKLVMFTGLIWLVLGYAA